MSRWEEKERKECNEGKSLKKDGEERGRNGK